MVNVFCIDGIIVRVEREKAEARLPYDIMDPKDNPLMKGTIEAQGKKVDYLTPMTSEMLIADIGGEVLENINKNTVNKIAEAFNHLPVFGKDEDGGLKKL